MKPDWSDLPDWSNYLAMDGDGIWCWFMHKPEFDHTGQVWLLPDGTPDDSPFDNDYVPDESGIDWDFAFDTLEKRP